jgi:hypothetical protein
VKDALDEEQIGQREHSARKTSGQLRGDYPSDPRGFQQADVTTHKISSLAPEKRAFRGVSGAR